MSLAFTAIGVAALHTGDLGVGLSCTILFGLGSIVFTLQLFTNASCLRLTEEGFVIRSLFRTHPLIPWHQVSNFRVGTLPPHGMRMVIYDSNSPAKQALRDFSRELVGASDGLPNSYGMKHAALAELMNTWRHRAVSTRPPSPIR